KNHVAQSLWRIIDRAIQVHGALGYSTDTPLADMLKQARRARFADGADEVHQQTIARNVIASWEEHGNLPAARRDLPPSTTECSTWPRSASVSARRSRSSGTASAAASCSPLSPPSRTSLTAW